jgi:two-component system sensor histidine kinase UhpB
MLTIDPLRPGRRLERPRTHDTEVVALTDAFNAMLDRLEDERRESARRALAAQEAERRRIARELHDEIGQTLTAVTLQAERAAASGGDEGELLAIAAETRRSLDDVRRIARELRPEALDDLGLVNALIALCTRVQGQGGVHVERRLTGGLPPLTAEAELVIYRVAQESLTNVIRHAAATHAVVSLDHSDGRVTLSVSDDGRGLPEPLPARTNGISGMRERAMLVGGRLSVSTPAGGGTEVRLELPVATP